MTNVISSDAPSDRFFRLGAQQIHVHESGNASPGAPKVLLLHSGGFTSRQWRRLGERLAPTYRVIAPDLIGYGESTRIADGAPFHFHEDVAIVEALAESLEGPLHVVGHSYGGLVGLLLALHHPKKVLSLSLYEPVAFGVLEAKPDDEAAKELARVQLPDGAEVDDTWLNTFVDWWNGAGAWAGMNDATKNAFRQVGWKLYQEVKSLTTDATTRATYATIETPTLFLGGDKSPETEAEVIRVLAKAMPHAKLEVLAGVGHMGPITHAAQVNERIAANLEENSR